MKVIHATMNEKREEQGTSSMNLILFLHVMISQRGKNMIVSKATHTAPRSTQPTYKNLRKINTPA